MKLRRLNFQELLRSAVPNRETGFMILAGLMVAAGLPPFKWTGLLVPLGLAILFQRMSVADRPGRVAWQFGLVHQAALLHWLFFLVPAKSIPTRALVPVQAIAAIVYVSAFYLLNPSLFLPS